MRACRGVEVRCEAGGGSNMQDPARRREATPVVLLWSAKKINKGGSLLSIAFV